MGRTILLVAVLIVVVGGAVALATLDIPAPSSRVEVTIPNDRFAQ
jgi:hypothetical protein